MRWQKRQLNLVRNCLISGPVGLDKPAGVTVIDVESAAEMFEAVRAQFDDAAIVIKSAAVADYRPKEIHPQKMKKQAGDAVIELERTTDILKTIGAHEKRSNPCRFCCRNE